MRLNESLLRQVLGQLPIRHHAVEVSEYLAMMELEKATHQAACFIACCQIGCHTLILSSALRRPLFLLYTTIERGDLSQEFSRSAPHSLSRQTNCKAARFPPQNPSLALPDGRPTCAACAIIHPRRPSAHPRPTRKVNVRSPFLPCLACRQAGQGRHARRGPGGRGTEKGLSLPG